MKDPSYKDKFALANILGPLSIGLIFYDSPLVFKLLKKHLVITCLPFFVLLHPTYLIM